MLVTPDTVRIVSGSYSLLQPNISVHLWLTYSSLITRPASFQEAIRCSNLRYQWTQLLPHYRQHKLTSLLTQICISVHLWLTCYSLITRPASFQGAIRCNNLRYQWTQLLRHYRQQKLTSILTQICQVHGGLLYSPLNIALVSGQHVSRP